jgi:Site-specific recombinase XerD
MSVKAERSEYDNHKIIKLIFDYDVDVIKKIRAIPGARWSRSMRCWYLADQPQKITALQNMGIELEQKSVPDVIASDHNSELLLQFADYMKEKRYSARTINSYVECLRIFLNYHSSKHYLDIGNEDIALFNQDYILKQKLSATYQGQFINAIKLFYAKIPRRKLVIEHLERPRTGSPLPKVLSKEDVAKVLSSTENIKHKTMLSLIYSCGLRRNELINMQITDIDSKRNVINIRHAKGDKDRIVPLSEKILVLLREYYKKYRPQKWLFEGSISGTQYAESSLNKVFQNARDKAGIRMPCTLHSLRHCYATHLLEAGTDIRYIQALLGHKHSKTTEIYTHVTTKSIQKIKSPFDDLEL